MHIYTSTIQSKETKLIKNDKTNIFYKPSATESILNYRMSLDGKDKIKTINDYDITTFETLNNSIIIPLQSHELVFEFNEDYLNTCEKRYIKNKCCVFLEEKNKNNIHHIIEMPYIWIDLVYMPKIITKKI